MSATAFIVLLVVAIFVVDFVYRSWRETEWKRRWRNRDDQDG